MNKCGFLRFEPLLTGRVKALSHLSCCLLHLCWAACMPLTSGLMDCIHSTEEGCEISLDLSWYCYTIWNETLSQGESNYLSSLGPWICHIFFPSQSLFAVYEITPSTFWTNQSYDLANCIYWSNPFCFWNRGRAAAIFICTSSTCLSFLKCLLRYLWRIEMLRSED